MNEALEDLTKRILERYKSTAPHDRILVGICAIPGGGKSTLAYPLVDRLNATLLGEGSEASHATQAIDSEEMLARRNEENFDKGIAVAVGLDGWHFTRAQLEEFADPDEAKRRRGAAFTFDAESYLKFVQDLRKTPALASIPFNTFSHALKDPQPSPFAIEPRHRIVVIEGLYCLLDCAPWNSATNLLDERIWIECEPQVARERLIRRHLKSGIEDTPDKAAVRVDKSDMLNGEYIRKHLTEPTFTLRSIEDPNFAITTT